VASDQGISNVVKPLFEPKSCLPSPRQGGAHYFCAPPWRCIFGRYKFKVHGFMILLFILIFILQFIADPGSRFAWYVD
jgi:hypothetical protein